MPPAAKDENICRLNNVCRGTELFHVSPKRRVMKKNILLSFIIVLAASAGTFAQTPVPDPDTIPNPVQEGDPAVRHMPPGLDYVDDKQRITPGELPDPVKQTLESSAQYTDWQRASVFRDKDKEEYIVEFTEAEKTTSYRFDKEGKPIVEEEQ